MSLANQTCWVVGGVGIIGRGITRGLLQAGATVIVNSRSEERLSKLSDSLGNPSKLVLVERSLLPGHAKQTVAQTLGGTIAGYNNNNNNSKRTLQHVVSHGAVRWWAKPSGGHYDYYEYKPGCDETYSLSIRGNTNLLDMTCDEFQSSSAQLASLHFAAAQELLPRLSSSSLAKGQNTNNNPTYTFVTGDGSNQSNGKRTSMGEINSHHVWGLSAALREELSCETTSSRYNHHNSKGHRHGGEPQPQPPRIICREIRVGLPIPPASQDNSLSSHISEHIGNLCAGLAATSSSSSASDNNKNNNNKKNHQEDEYGRLIQIQSQAQLEQYMTHYNAVFKENDTMVEDHLPRYACE